MSQVTINICSDSEPVSHGLHNAGRITDLIRERAFNLFQHRGGADSSEVDDFHSHEGKNGDICFCEFSDKQLFRRMSLPGRIDVDRVSASLDKGILRINAPKAAATAIAASR